MRIFKNNLNCWQPLSTLGSAGADNSVHLQMEWWKGKEGWRYENKRLMG